MEQVHRSQAGLIAAAMGVDGGLVSERFDRGCQCYVIRNEGAIGAYGWLSADPEWIGEIQLTIKPREREGYIWNCVTLPEQRRRGMFGSLVTGISLEARRLGRSRLWIGSVAATAEKTLEVLGFQRALQFDSTVLLGLHLMRVRPGSNRAIAADASSAVGARPGLMIRGSRLKRH